MSRDIDKRLERLKKQSEIMDIVLSSTTRIARRWAQNPEDYDGEIHLFDNITSDSAVNRGYIAFFATFVILRRRQIASLLTRIVWRNHYQLDAPPSANKPRGLVRKASRLGFDFTISSYMALGVYMYSFDYMLLASSLACIPLVPHQSMIAKELCPGIQDVARQLKESPDIEMDYTTVALLQSFSRNCRLRQAYERKLRKEQGLADNAPVSVPPPGVPIDYTLEESAFAHTDDEHETFVGMKSEEWAKSLVNDQEQMEKENDK
jgi:hypothetical protein